jgi:hypothetical protein
MPRRKKGEPAQEPQPVATDAQVAARVEELLRIRLDGAEFWDVKEYIAEKVAAKDPVWGEHEIGQAMIYRYLQRVDDLIAASCKTARRKLLRTHLAKRRNLYAKAVAAADYATAKAILKDEAELLNLYPPKRTEMSGPKGGPIPTTNLEMTEDERARAVAALLARLGQANT